MVRTTLGAEVETAVSVEGAESIDFVSASSSDTVPAGGSEDVIVRPPSGSIYVLTTVRILAFSPPGSTTGDHSITIQSESLKIGGLSMASNHTDLIEYNLSNIRTATANKDPPSAVAQGQALKGLRGDESNGFLIKYRNNTDASQTDQRQIRLWLREIQVAE